MSARTSRSALPRRAIGGAIGALALLASRHVGGETFEVARGDVRVQISESSVAVSTGSRGGGVEVAWYINPTKRYRLRGGPLCETFSMRIRIDHGAYEYRPTSWGATISGASHAAVYLYSDEPRRSCDMPAPLLVRCDDCPTRDDLLAAVRADVDVARLRGVDLALALMRWSMKEAPWAAGDAALVDPAGKTAAEMLRLFRGGRTGVYCSGRAEFLRGVLWAHGIDAVTVGYGIAGSSLTHVVVAAEIAGRFFLLSPTFGIAFTRDSAPADLFGALADRSNIAAVHAATAGALSIAAYAGEHRDILRSSGIAEDAFLLLDLMRQEITSVGPSMSPAMRARFISDLRRIGIVTP